MPGLAAALSALVLLLAGASARPPAHGFREIASGFASPTYVTSAPGNASTLYVVEQRGTIRIVRGRRVVGTFLDIHDNVLFDGERGLLGLAFDPDYAQNGLFYVDYSDRRGDTHVTEYRASGGIGDPSTGRD